MSDFIQKAFALSGPERGELASERISAVLKADTLGWVHLAADHPETGPWIEGQLDYLDTTVIDALLADETRPRATRVGNGVIVILRGVNTNEGADPEDMVSIRLWLDEKRIVSASRRRLKAVRDIADMLRAGQGPSTPGDFLCLLAERLNLRIELFWHELELHGDDLEETILDAPGPDMRLDLVDTRRQAIVLRRYISPQRDALGGLFSDPPDWMSVPQKRRIHEAQNALSRMVEDIDSLRERLGLVREELAGQLSDRLNRNMYLLSILSAVFLPLGFLTGVFGINLGGMPGSESGAAFWLFCAALLLIAGLQVWILRLMKWV